MSLTSALFAYFRPSIAVAVTDNDVGLEGSVQRAAIAPIFHVVPQVQEGAGRAKWIIVGAPGVEPVQPATYTLHLFRRSEWPDDAAHLWGDFVTLFFDWLLRERWPPWSRPAVHVTVTSATLFRDRSEFEHHVRKALSGQTRCLSFTWA